MAIGSKHLRHLSIFDPSITMNQRIIIVGAGATGSYLAHALVKLGITNLEIWDMDTVEVHNLSLQNFKYSQLGINKAIATKDIIKEFENIEIEAISKECKELNPDDNTIVVFALDNYTARKQILKSIVDTGCILIDIRTGSESIHIQTLNTLNDDQVKRYKSTLFSDSDTNNLPCTARNIIYNIYYTTAIVTNVIKRILCKQPIPTNHMYSFKGNNPRQILESTLKELT